MKIDRPPTGTLKLTGFGLADSRGHLPRGIEPGYRAPEEIRGASGDQRSDIFSCGAILYELLSGYPAFPGRTEAETADAILERNPERLPGDVPDALRHLFAMSPDAHTTREFGAVRYGLDQARRAGLDKRSVLNVLPWSALAPLFRR